MSLDDYSFFKNADYKMWNHEIFVSLEEFIHLIEGFEPLAGGVQNKVIPNGATWPDWDLDAERLLEFKSTFKKICRMGYELPKATTNETDVRFLKPDVPHYESVFLINWAKSRGIQIHPSYCPVEAKERSNKQFMKDYEGRLALSRDEFIKILVHYNPGKDEKYFKTNILDAIEVKVLSTILLPYDGRVPFEQRNFKFKSQSLIEYAVRMKWNFPEEFNSKTDSNIKSEMNLRSHFKDGEIMIDGIIDVRQIESTKLVLALENYMINMRLDSKKIPASEAVKQALVSKYGIDGVSAAMARTIDECSRHDSKSNNPPKNARKKTIFFQ